MYVPRKGAIPPAFDGDVEAFYAEAAKANTRNNPTLSQSITGCWRGGEQPDGSVRSPSYELLINLDRDADSKLTRELKRLSRAGAAVAKLSKRSYRVFYVEASPSTPDMADRSVLCILRDFRARTPQ